MTLPGEDRSPPAMPVSAAEVIRVLPVLEDAGRHDEGVAAGPPSERRAGELPGRPRTDTQWHARSLRRGSSRRVTSYASPAGASGSAALPLNLC